MVNPKEKIKGSVVPARLGLKAVGKARLFAAAACGKSVR